MLGLPKGMGMVGMKVCGKKKQQECAIQIEPTDGNLGYFGLRKKEFEVYGKKSGGIKLRITGTKFWECKWELVMRVGKLIFFFPPYF